MTAKLHKALQEVGADVATSIAARFHLKKRAVDDDAYLADFNPTEAQQHAGNYKMGHLQIGPLAVSIENPAGTKRRAKWKPLPHHYGYIKRTQGADGDHVDCFVRVGTQDTYNGPVFVIDQVIDGKFDEHKCMIGWRSKGKAVAAYLAAYQDGWEVGPVTRMPMDAFTAWLENGDTTKPVFGGIKKAVEDSWEDDVADADWQPLSDALVPSFAKMLKTSGVAELIRVKWQAESGITQVSRRALAYAQERAASLVSSNTDWSLVDTTRDRLRGLVTQAVSETWSGTQLRDAILDSSAFSQSRAKTIARTELSHAFNAGNQAAGRVAGAVGKMSILGSEHSEDVPDGDECDDNADEGVIAFEEQFSSGDDYGPFHPNCVCMTVNVYPDDPEAQDLMDEESDDE